MKSRDHSPAPGKTGIYDDLSKCFHKLAHVIISSRVELEYKKTDSKKIFNIITGESESVQTELFNAESIKNNCEREKKTGMVVCVLISSLPRTNPPVLHL